MSIKETCNLRKESFELLATNFGIKGSFRSNDVAKSVNDKLGMKLAMAHQGL
ncbi:MAG: hypothetical protein QXY52_02940 [Conexivisphaerales archaeon]